MMGSGRAGRLYQARFFFHLGSLRFVFLLGILHRLQVVSGAVIVHEFPAPLGDSFLTQSHDKEP